MLFDGFKDGAVGGEINPKGLLAEQVFACADDVGIELLVQDMRHGAVNRVNVAAVEQVVIVGGFDGDAVKVGLEPAEERRVGIADAGDDRGEGELEQVAPAGDGAAELAPHEAEAENAEAN